MKTQDQLQEITRLRAEVQRLRAQRDDLRSLIEGGQATHRELADIKYALDTSTIVAITDQYGLITYANDKLCEISGYSQDELIGKTHRVVNSGYHPKSFFSNLWATIQAGEVWSGEICNRTKNGDHYWVHTTIVPFLDGDQDPYQFIAIRSDITQRKQAENDLRETREQLMMQTLFAQRLSALAALTGGIAHELNQPLSGVRVYAETVASLASQGTLTNERTEQLMGKIIRQVDRASKVIIHMREFASEQTDRSATVLDLKELVEHVLELVGEQLRAHGIEFINKIESGHAIRANHGRMEQVLINLITNAKDALDDKNAASRQITCSSCVADGQQILIIADNGPGVPDEVRNLIFEPFVTTKGFTMGTGLGLSICHGILNDYNASIELASTSSEGSEFHLKFPRNSEEAP